MIQIQCSHEFHHLGCNFLLLKIFVLVDIEAKQHWINDQTNSNISIQDEVYETKQSDYLQTFTKLAHRMYKFLFSQIQKLSIQYKVIAKRGLVKGGSYLLIIVGKIIPLKAVSFVRLNNNTVMITCPVHFCDALFVVVVVLIVISILHNSFPLYYYARIICHDKNRERVEQPIFD